MNAPPTFYLPTGRMGNKPAIQILGPPSTGLWRNDFDKSKLNGRAYVVSRQKRLKRGDLVVWAPTGSPGLWLVTDIEYFRGPGVFPDAGYSQIERKIAKITTSVDDGVTVNGERTLQINRVDVPPGKVRLTWEGGWGGYEGKRYPVVVKIEEVRVPNEMEALGIAAL